MNERPATRRWFRWSLRTMFVVVMVICAALGWTTYQLNWIRQRSDFRSQHVQVEALVTRKTGIWKGIPSGTVDAPRHLWAFRDQGYAWVAVFTDEEATEIERAASLFPEAKVITVTRPSAFDGIQF